jgi:hypothetical protein
MKSVFTHFAIQVKASPEFLTEVYGFIHSTANEGPVRIQYKCPIWNLIFALKLSKKLTKRITCFHL